MKKRLQILFVLTFLCGMFGGHLLTDFFSESKAEMAMEEHSVATISSDTCTHVEIVKSNSVYQFDNITSESAEVVNSDNLLKELVSVISNDKSVITIKHSDFTIEYIVVDKLNDSTKMYIKSFNNQYGIKNKAQPISYIVRFSNFIPYLIDNAFDRTYELICKLAENTPFIKARARSPGNIITDYFTSNSNNNTNNNRWVFTPPILLNHCKIIKDANPTSHNRIR